jgi:hypothetical protein
MVVNSRIHNAIITVYVSLEQALLNSTTSGVVRVGNGVFSDSEGNADGSIDNNLLTLAANTFLRLSSVLDQ